MCVGVVPLVQTLEQKWCILAEQEEHITIKEVAVIHSVYHLTQTTTKRSKEHRMQLICMELSMKGQMD